MKITHKLILLITSIVLVSLVLAGIISYVGGNRSVTEHTFWHLESVAVLKENQLTNFIDEQFEELELIRTDQNIVSYMSDCHYSTCSMETEEIRETRMRNALQKFLTHSDFSEIFIMDSSGEIDVSTNLDNEHKIKTYEPYFEQGIKSHYLHSFFYNPSQQKPQVIASAPLHNDNGTVIGVVAARVIVDRINTIMLENSGLGRTGETYLVNSYNYAVTQLAKVEDDPLKAIVHSPGINDCIETRHSRLRKDIYPDYVHDMVVGVYKWIPEYKTCLLVEMDYQEAYASVYETLLNMFFFLLLTGIIVSIIGYYFSHRIIRPLHKLKKAARNIAEGNIETRTNINSADEIGELSNSFDIMVDSLQKSQHKLKEHEKDLHKKVAQRTRELQKKIHELQATKNAMMNILEDQDEVNKELYATREQLQQKVEKMELMDKKKDEMLSITAHELKTPITSIKGFTDLLRNDKIMNDEKKRKKYFDIIIDETTRIADLVSDILDLSRLGLGTFKFEYEQTSVQQVVEELKKMTEVMIRQKGLNIKYSVEDVDMVTDASRLVQVLANLVNNAIKYTEKGSITVEAFKEGEFVHFRVKDTGNGIAKKELPNVFDRFYQADSSYTRKVGGTGLGLSIAKAIVEHLGGEIWVHSKFGRGTVFEFTVKQKILKGST